MNCNKPLYSARIIIELITDQGGPRKFQGVAIPEAINLVLITYS